MKTDRITRILKLITALQSGENNTIADLGRITGVSRRTVFRDLRDLQRAGIPCRYHASSGGYTVMPEFYLPPLDLKPEEALGLMMLVRKARSQVQLPFTNAAVLAALKIENNFSGKVREYVNKALKHVSALGRPHARERLIEEVFSKLQGAILANQKTLVRYRENGNGSDFDGEFCPYHLVEHCGSWHVVGLVEQAEKVKALRLSGIEEIRVTREYFEPERDFEVSEYIGSAWSMHPEGKLYHVKLWFAESAAGAVTETLWHSSQKSTRHPDGSATVEFRLDGLSEVKWWILGYGDQVRVLSPEELKEEIYKIASNMVQINRPGSQ